MRKKVNRITLSVFLIGMMLLAAVPMKNGAEIVSLAQPVWSETEIRETYDLGETFTLPVRTVNIGDTTVTAQTVLEFPDGTATRKAQVELTAGGLYTLTYSATVDGKAYTDTQTFTVRRKLVSVGSAESSVEYGSYTTTYNGTAHTNKPGLMVRLAEGDTLTLNQLIDVSDATAQDVLVEAFVTPDIPGNPDFLKLWYTFTDASNPDVYMRVSVRQSAEGYEFPNSYYLAGGNGQQMKGYEAGLKTLHVEDDWGAVASHSFSLKFGGASSVWTNPEDAAISLRYDAKNVALYTGSTQIIDFDDPTFYDVFWKGFPSGKVRLTISADMYNGVSANFCLTQVMGVDLKSDSFSDDDGPVITVENEYAVMPEAEKGGTYPVPSATAYDLYSGNCRVRVSAWYNYNSSNAVMLDIENGRFATDRIGNYAIVYEASDAQGNVSSEVLWVHASAAVEDPTITLTGTHADSLYVGELILPVQYDAVSHTGNATVTVTAVLDGETYDVTAKGFRPEKAGTYTVRYTVSDYIGQTATADYSVEVILGSVPVFVDVPDLPRTYISGSPYVLPEIYANDYRSGTLERKLAYAEITDASGTRTVQGGESYTPTVDTNGEVVRVVFKCDGAESETYEIPAIRAWINDADGRPRLQIDNYFYTDGGITVTKNTSSLTVSAARSDGGWLFANNQLAAEFEMQLRGIKDSSDFSALKIILTDAYDETESIEIALNNESGKTYLSVNGGDRAELSGSFASGSAFTVGYADGYVSVGGTPLAAVTATAAGEAFDGFTSEYLTVSAYFENAAAGAAYEILSINGHTMTNSTVDRVTPKILIYGDYGGSYNIGDTVTLPRAAAGDVLDPNVKMYMTVTDGSGNAVTDVNGVLLQDVDPSLEYTIQLSAYGQYSVSITAEDTFNQRINRGSFPYAINVDDDTPPEITFSEDFQTTVKVGTVIILPDFTVSDNISDSQAIRVSKYVLTPDGVLVTLPGESNSIVTASVGVYEFRLLVADEAGNVTMVRKAVTVTAE